MRLWPFGRRNTDLDGAEDPIGEGAAARFLASLSDNRFAQVLRVVEDAKALRARKGKGEPSAQDAREDPSVTR